jgi:hypothetical protein
MHLISRAEYKRALLIKFLNINAVLKPDFLVISARYKPKKEKNNKK